MKRKLIDRKNYIFSIDTAKKRVYFLLQKGVCKIEDMDVFLSDWKGVIKEI